MKNPKIKLNAGPPLTMDQARKLHIGQILYHQLHRNADGTPQRWRVNGKVRTWKRDPSRIQVPIKYGLRGYDYIREYTLHLLSETQVQGE